MTKINVYEKANIISFERELVSEYVARSMGKNLYSMLDSIKNIELDELTNKKVTKAMNMLTNLTYELIKSNNIDNVLKTRNRINYYINRIKTLTNVSDNLFYDNLFLYRDDIKEHVRIVKRSVNVSKITTTIYDTISKDEKKSMNALMAKERAFNKRLKGKYNNPRTIKNNKDTKEEFEYNKIEEVKPNFIVLDGGINYDEIEVSNKNIINAEGNIEFEQIEDTNKDELVNIEGSIEYEQIDESNKDVETLYSNIPNFTTHEDFEYDEDLTPAIINREFERIELNGRLIGLINNYKLVKTNKYDSKKTIGNIKNLIINIPKYLKNKKAIKQMERDYNVFYHGRDLYRLIRYSKYDNSFKYAFGEIFKSNDLEVERAKKYRNILESVYGNMVVDEAQPEDFKYLKLKKASA